MTAVLSSATGVIALLDEPDSALKIHALNSLNGLVHTFWSEIASAINKIEELCEDEEFTERTLASIVASKIFYHLEELDDALKFALSAGERFDITNQSEYTETLIAKCIDEYIRLRLDVDKKDKIDQRLVIVVERMFDRCFQDKQLKQALGIALEAHRLDKVREVIQSSEDIEEMLKHCLKLSLTVIKNREFRQKVMRELADMYQSLHVPDYISVCQCLMYLDDAKSVASILLELINGEKKSGWLIAYQVAYELAENENQPFLLRVSSALPKAEKPKQANEGATATAAAVDDGVDVMETDNTSPEEEMNIRLANLRFILSGESAIALNTQFMYTHNHTDLMTITNIKTKVESRNTVVHCTAIVAHAFMQCGTTRDDFIRNNLDWLARALNWAKMSVTASFGVIHRGHLQQSRKILAPYLPQEGVSTSPYLVGGALYGLGLIHANRGGDQREYLLNALKTSAAGDETIEHGACLGLGLNCMATNDQELYDSLKDVLYHDNAVAGEAAGIAMGLVLLGSGTDSATALEEMMAYAHDTQHEKIVRGLSFGLALIMSGREEQADLCIDTLLEDKDFNLRYGACFMIALAFAATANNSAVRRLLHVAVSDVNVDVRRAAVMSLGFVLCNVPERVPGVVELLSGSYSSHVRYGAAMAIGIACAGTGLRGAIDLLMPMTKDRIDFVRQGAMIALAMVLIQVNEKEDSRAAEFRTLLRSIVDSKHGDTMSKVGSILAAGIVDAGGRNVTIALRSPAGHRRTAAIVGMALFTQYWYWYPLVHFLSLSFTSTAIIGLNSDLKMPKSFSVRSNAHPSMYAYPPNLQVEKEKVIEKVPTAQLSISAKAKAKAAKKKKDNDDDPEDDAMDVDESSDPNQENKEAEKNEKEKEKDKKTEKTEKDADSTDTSSKKKKVTIGAAFEVLENPSRVTTSQRKVISLQDNQRYVPVKKNLNGIILLTDTRPTEPEELIVPVQPKVLGVGEEEEVSPPAPFEFSR